MDLTSSGLNGASNGAAPTAPTHIDEEPRAQSDAQPEMAETPIVAPSDMLRPSRPSIEFPDDLEPLAQVLLYDDDANGRRPVRMACLDVRDLGGGCVVIVGKVDAAIRVRRLPDRAIVEVPPKSVIAVPVISDLIQIVFEMQSRPNEVLEGWFWPLPLVDCKIVDGMRVQRYATRGGWLEGITKKELLASSDTPVESATSENEQT